MTDTKHSAVEREVKITVSGSVGCGKSALLGEIEIMCKALGIPVRYEDAEAAQAEKNMTHAEWTAELEMYKPSVVLVEHIDRASQNPTASTQILDTPEKRAANALLFDMIGKPEWDLKCAAEHLKKFARAAIAAAAPAGEPVAKVIPGSTIAFLANCKDFPKPGPLLYAAPVPAAAPKAALTDEQIDDLYRKHALSEAGPGEISFARAIEAASGPNAALVEALQKALGAMTSTVFPGDSEIVIMVRNTLSNAGATL